MLFDFSNAPITEDLGLAIKGPGYRYLCPAKTVTFSRLSEPAAAAALRLGYSPPISLPVRRRDRDGYFTAWWILEGETAAPSLEIRLSLSPFRDIADTKDFMQRFFECGVPFFIPQHVPVVRFAHRDSEHRTGRYRLP